MTLRHFPLTQEKADRLLLEQDRKFTEMLRKFLDGFGVIIRQEDPYLLRLNILRLTELIFDLAEKPITTPAGVELRHEIYQHCQHIIATTAARSSGVADPRFDGRAPSLERMIPKRATVRRDLAANDVPAVEE